MNANDKPRMSESCSDTLCDSWRRAVDNFPRQEHLVVGDGEATRSFTYEVSARRVDVWCGALAGYGVSPGDRVAFMTVKSPEQVWLFYAIWSVGAVAVPVSETLGELEVGFILRDCSPSLIVVSPEFQSTVAELAGDVATVSFGQLDRPGGRSPDGCETSPDDLACLIYTSGSTGLPKGVMLSHRNLLVNAECALKAIDIGDDERILSLLPYWHSFALMVEVVCAVRAGGAVIICGGRRDFRRNIARYQPTIILVVPRIAESIRGGIEKQLASRGAMARFLTRWAMANAVALPPLGEGRSKVFRQALHKGLLSPLILKAFKEAFGGRLRFLVTGGAPISPEEQLFFHSLGLPLLQGYGLTETSPLVSVGRPESNRPGSCGMMADWLTEEMRGDYTFVNDQGLKGRDLEGELLVRGACVMQGYWNHRDGSAKTVEDGWLRTGDTGKMVDGHLYINGRAGNLIVLQGGEKLHPEHVEQAICRSPWIEQAMVFGDGCKNVYVAVNLNDELARKESRDQVAARTRQEIRDHTTHLASFQRPKDALVLPPFTIEDGTLTPTLKIRRGGVWKRYNSRLAELMANNRDVPRARAGKTSL